MRRKFLGVLYCAAIIVSPAPLSAGDEGAEPARDEQGKITDKRHPDYVKCRTESVAGSRAKKRRICLTNEQWAEVARQGRSMATAIVEGGRAGIDWEAVQQNKRGSPCQQFVC